MKTLNYIVFVELKVAGAGACMSEIATKVSLEMKDEDYDRLMQLVETYKGEKWRIAKTVEREFRHIHDKLMKGAMEDVRYLLTVNAVESWYSEDSWSLQKEDRQTGMMSREELTRYYTDRYGIELDFDEDDFSYRFSEDGRKGVFTEWF